MSNEQQCIYKLLNCRLINVCVAIVLLFQTYQVIGNECGTVHLQRPTILDGSHTLEGEWPFIAALYRNNKSEFFCGGTIISKRHVLTAAHCVKGKFARVILSPDDMEVRIGAYNLSKENVRQGILSNVTEIIVHPEWDEYSDAYDADIAILVLSENVVFTNSIRPVCLPSEDDNIDGGTINVTGKIVGWRLSQNAIHKEFPRQAFIKTLNDSYCYRRDHGMVLLASARTFCGVYGDGTPLEGDSGGGFFVISNSTWVQYGIISSSSTNRTGHIDKNSVSLYTNVRSYKSWIDKVIKSERVETLTPSTQTQTNARLPCRRHFNEHTGLITRGNHTTHGFWHAAIYPIYHVGVDNQLFTDYKCGGTLINSVYIITASHCVSQYDKAIDPTKVSVSLGRLNSGVNESSAQSFEIAAVIQHPHYNWRQLDNDIAMIRLSTEVTFSNYVQPICLWDSNELELSEVIGKEGTVIGWGFTENNKTSQVLQQAGSRNDTGVCNGDSGDSMDLYGLYYMRGIVSVGVNKININTGQFVCDSDEYAIFTDVAQYLPWIEDGTNECGRKVQCAIEDWRPDRVSCSRRSLYDYIRLSEQKCKKKISEDLSVTYLNVGSEFEVFPDVSDAIHEDLFMELRNVKKLDLSENEILPTGLFRNNQKLEDIYFENNKIKKAETSLESNLWEMFALMSFVRLEHFVERPL